ncbi:MAG: hypothetical protein GY895_07545, partial [Phycisphaera sp.]|nr:hypothetical protein [Phycisphaera sp.]
VRNCTFTNCVVRNNQGYNPFGGGGGLYHYSGDLDLDACLFQNCGWVQETSSPEYSGGGAIYQYQGTLTLTNTDFDGCTTTYLSGSQSDYFMRGGAIRIHDGLVDQIDGCNFVDCASASDGGVIFVYSHQGALGITGSTFTRCTGQDRGGAVFMGNGIRMIATDCDFSECSSEGDGGALFLTASQNELATCTFNLCSSGQQGGAIRAENSECVFDDCVFSDCTAASNGGGFSSDSSSHHFTNCDFTGCSGSSGGGIYASGSSQNLAGCSFTECTAVTEGGGSRLGSNAVVSNCTFTGNTAGSKFNSPQGGGLRVDDYGTITDCEFTGNRCVFDFANGQDGIGGGGVFSDYELSVSNTSFTGNLVEFNGDPNASSDMYAVGGGAISGRSRIAIENECVFDGNRVLLTNLQARESGGGAVLYRGNDNDFMRIEDSTFTDNEVVLEGDRYYQYVGGGAIHRWYGGSSDDLQVTACTFSGNRFLGPPEPSRASGGGAMFTQAYRPQITDCIFADNFTESSNTDVDRFFRGGAIYAQSSGTRLTGCDFTGNHCGGDGGGVYLSSSSEVVIDDCTFTGNGAYQGPAGALRMPNDGGGLFTGSTACSNAPSNFGDLVVDDPSNTITVRCEGDTPVVQVPAEYESITKAVRFAFDGDTIEIGPGTWNEAIEFLGRDLSLIGTDGADNTIIDATGWGRPAIVADRADGIGTITGLTLTGADVGFGFGGGARLAGSMTVSDCVITGNRLLVENGTSGGGAGVAFITPGAAVALDSVTIIDNELSSEVTNTFEHATGAGLHAVVGALQITNATIEANQIDGLGSGGGLSADSGTVTIVDSVFKSNGVDVGQGGQARFRNSVTTVSNSEFIDGTVGNGNGAGVDTFGGAINLFDCLLRGNEAGGTGGGVHSISTAIGLHECDIDQNVAGSAGAGWFESSPVLVSDCEITANVASDAVGGIALIFAETPVIQDSRIVANVAGGNAGGVRLASIQGENGARIERCTILDNVAGGAGGGLRLEEIETKVTIVDGIIGENQAEVGGGINAFDTRQLTLQNVAVYNNHAELFGGGLYDEGYGGGLQETVINASTVSGNTAGAVGGGIYLLLREMAISNTAFCGNDPGQIIGFWTDYGGNVFSNGTCFFDCNANGIEDGTEIAEGGLEDCDQNGVPDLCEIADGSAEDCDGDGIPDTCAKGGFVTATSGTLPAFGVGVPQSLPLGGTPAAGGPVTITIEAVGDLFSELEFGIVTVNQVEVGRVFESGVDCGDTALLESLVVDAEIFNMLTVTGPAEIAVVGSIAVDGDFCPDGSTRITIDYLRVVDGDCNDNGLLDQCEIAGGLADDCDGDGVPDDCEIDDGMASDCNGNGQLDGCEIAAGDVDDNNGDGIPDSCQCIFDLNLDDEVGGSDVGIFLGLWGTDDPIADFDGDGVVRAGDLGLLLAAFGPCF